MNPVFPEPKTGTVDIGSGHVLTLTEAGWLEDARWSKLEDEAIKQNKSDFDAAHKSERALTEDELRVQYFRLWIYAPMAACTKGEQGVDFPTCEQAIKIKLPYREAWLRKAIELNEHYFAKYLSDEKRVLMSLEDRKKKDKKPHA